MYSVKYISLFTITALFYAVKVEVLQAPLLKNMFVILYSKYREKG